jgi:putative transposase
MSVGIVEGHLMPDHVHMLLSVPPKYSVAMTIGKLKGQSAVRLHRRILRAKGTLFGRSFWARGYCVSIVGLDETMIRQYIRDQDTHERENDYEQGELDLQ